MKCAKATSHGGPSSQYLRPGPLTYERLVDLLHDALACGINKFRKDLSGERSAPEPGQPGYDGFQYGRWTGYRIIFRNFEYAFTSDGESGLTRAWALGVLRSRMVEAQTSFESCRKKDIPYDGWVEAMRHGALSAHLEFLAAVDEVVRCGHVA